MFNHNRCAKGTMGVQAIARKMVNNTVRQSGRKGRLVMSMSNAVRDR